MASSTQQSVVHHVLKSYKRILDLSPAQIDLIGTEIPIPSFPEKDICELSERALIQFKRNPIVVNVSAPIYVVGDIHGNIFDLLRILILSRPPPSSRFLFLGDYVDRGQYSIEVLTLLFALYCAYPDYVTILRGNHEFDSINFMYGFYTEVQQQYHTDTLFNLFNDAFAWMPLVAVINKTYFAVHGGICPDLDNMAQIERIRRPLNSFEVEFVSDLLWSDPTTDTKHSGKSGRGAGVTFTAKSLDIFLEKFGMKAIFRAHQCVSAGISKFHGDKLFTVFSCSNYDEGIANRCGLVFLGSNLEVQLFSLPPITVLNRLKAKFSLLPFVPVARIPAARSSLAMFINPPVVNGFSKRAAVTVLSNKRPKRSTSVNFDSLTFLRHPH